MANGLWTPTILSMPVAHSTGTYTVENIAKSEDLKTVRKFNMNFQFVSVSKSQPAFRTILTIALYAVNEKAISLQNAFRTDHINLSQLTLTNLTICQSPPHLRHIQFSNIQNLHIGVLLGTACIAFTYALEWIRGSANHPSGIRTELGSTIVGEFHVPRRETVEKKSQFFATAILNPKNRSPHGKPEQKNSH